MAYNLAKLVEDKLQELERSFQILRSVGAKVEEDKLQIIGGAEARNRASRRRQ
jgi:hypothetical protein